MQKAPITGEYLNGAFFTRNQEFPKRSCLSEKETANRIGEDTFPTEQDISRI